MVEWNGSYISERVIHFSLDELKHNKDAILRFGKKRNHWS